MNFYVYLINNPNLSLNIYIKLLYFAINDISIVFFDFNPPFKSSFQYKVTILICVYRFRIHNSYRAVINRYQMWILKICDKKIYIFRLRKLSENCTGLQGFLIFHSFGGGTGSDSSQEIIGTKGEHKEGQGVLTPLPLLEDLGGYTPLPSSTPPYPPCH